MKIRMRLLLLALLSMPALYGADMSFSGQFSGWALGNAERGGAQVGFHYLPEAFGGSPLASARLDGTLSLHLRGDYRFSTHEGKSSAQVYRAWVRWSTDRFEARFGLQKLDFGSALLLRPLMWFDSLDPRDPLHLTSGVSGGMVRWVSPRNIVIQGWALLGSGKPKGLELFPSPRNSVEFGGRVQFPTPKGEIAVTAHRRKAELPFSLFAHSGSKTAENRLAVDGKWDLGVGLWFEAARVQPETRIAGIGTQKFLTVGTDYTFPLGNGLHVLLEEMWSTIDLNLPNVVENHRFAAFQADYAFSLWDQFAAIYFFDQQRKELYQYYVWRRTYDNWSINLALLASPKTAALPFARTENALPFQGNCLFLIIVLNH
ncbi:MAG: hypothetical protein ONB12_04725 [candidate division KSB1 bacterium]|nr:hypothetical protein [candidate division KSB1 bacterium]